MLLASACAPTPAGGVGDAPMEGGAAIGSAAAARGESFVLVLSPEDCVSCDLNLARWVGPARDTSRHVAVVLTRAPSPEEERSIALLRLPVAGRLDKAARDRRLASPCVLRFLDGQPLTDTCEPVR